jgi:hypothetical protein
MQQHHIVLATRLQWFQGFNKLTGHGCSEHIELAPLSRSRVATIDTAPRKRISIADEVVDTPVPASQLLEITWTPTSCAAAAHQCPQVTQPRLATKQDPQDPRRAEGLPRQDQPLQAAAV